MSVSKERVYKWIIDTQKSSGQGLSGIVKLGNFPEVGGHLDELIEEGLVICMDTGGSLGHPETNKFYLPTKGYNVWQDSRDNGGGRAFTDFLNHVRLFLGCLESDSDDDGRSDTQKWINPSSQRLIQNVDFMKSYAIWLERNRDELEVMINLDEFYDAPNISFSEDEAEWIKSRGWYKKNKKISDCLKDSLEAVDNDKEIKSINKKLIELYERSSSNKEDELVKAKDEVDRINTTLVYRKKLNRWLSSLDSEKNVQEFI
jgi:hypothetical protein